MKLISMHVDDFGGLHNYDYVFEEGLNVVLHDNGWGKTTMASFLKAMLYGYDTKRSKDITENERRRYLPWQGGKYGGTLDFEADGVRYRIYRTFGETPRFDSAKIVNLDTNATARVPADKIGETFFHLDASAFQRSVFINQNGLSIGGAASSIHARLNALVSQANDVAAFDGAVASLTQEIKVYEKKGDRGQLGVIAREIEEKERIRDRLERDISEQDAARERIVEIEQRITQLDQEFAEKSKQLDEASGEEKRREETKRILADLDGQILKLQSRIEEIERALGGHVPGASEIEQVKKQVQLADSLSKTMRARDAEREDAAQCYQDLLEHYHGVLPEDAQLDRIRSIDGELQGIAPVNARSALSEQEAPEEYAAIKAIADEHPDYPAELEKTISAQERIETKLRELEDRERALKKETETWSETAGRYAQLKAELDACREKAEALKRYAPDQTDPVITRLEELQNRKQTLKVKRETLRSEALSGEETALLKKHSGALPDAAEGAGILKRQREAERLQSEVQGIRARLDGEKSRAESLAASLAHLDAVQPLADPGQETPGKSNGTVLIAAGVVVALAGIALGALVMPALFALAALGVILIVMGVSANQNAQKKAQAYAQRQAAYEQNQAALLKKQELLDEKNAVQKEIDGLEQQAAKQEQQSKAIEGDIAAWLEKWSALAGTATDAQPEDRIAEIGKTAETIAKLRIRQEAAALKRAELEGERMQIENALSEIHRAYPECDGVAIDEALQSLRENKTAYLMAEDQCRKAAKSEERLIEEASVSREALSQETSPRAAALQEQRDRAQDELESLIAQANETLTALDLDTDAAHIQQALREAETMLNVYKRYAERLNDEEKRQNEQKRRADELQQKLNEALEVLSGRFSDRALPERLALVREEIRQAKHLHTEIENAEKELARQDQELGAAKNAIADFIGRYGAFSSDGGEDEGDHAVLERIFKKTNEHAELLISEEQLEKQRALVANGQDQAADGSDGSDSEEAQLRAAVDALKRQRDALLVEYTQKSDQIRQADQSLERYPDVAQEIRTLYEHKQKAQIRVATLKRAITLITQAKENLANRYLSKVEDRFNRYMHVWLNNESIRGLLDVDFNVTIEEDDKVHVAEGYSTGYCDLIDFCMRLALVDTLFEKEQPFLILDDPFVNLDADRLEKALELLNVMAANKQIVYFVCHPIRAVETEENSASREKFLKLAEATRQSVRERQADVSTRRQIVRKKPKELYRIVGAAEGIPFKPARANYVITNSIFSMGFVPTEEPGGGHEAQKERTYELFFIDAVGHVLNERQILEYSNGKLSKDRIQFSLNTRDDSGNEFELLVRESGSDDYEIAARFPFKAKLSFTGTFGFDL